MTHRRSIRLVKVSRFLGHNRGRRGSEVLPESRTRLVKVLLYGDTDINIPESLESHELNSYIEYVCRRLADISHPSASQLQRVCFFAEVVKYFSKNAQKSIASFLKESREAIQQIFPPKFATSSYQQYLVKDTVLCIALWTTREYFRAAFGSFKARSQFVRKNKLNSISGEANSVEELNDGKFTINAFAGAAGLLPKVEDWVKAANSNPREEIRKKRLNAKLVRRIGRVKIEWTFDVSEHFKFTDRTLYLFCMPSKLVLDDENLTEKPSPEQALETMGFNRQFSNEVIRSYPLFFGRKGKAIFEDLEIPEPEDPYLRYVCLNSQSSQGSDKQQMWAKGDFQYLWPRIKDLELFISDTPPDNFWKYLRRDRRNSYGWYTFLFAFVVLILTFISTVFTGIQAVKSFRPSNPPSPSPGQGFSLESTVIITHHMTVAMTSQQSTDSGSPASASSTPSVSMTGQHVSPSVTVSSGPSVGAKAGIGIGIGLGGLLLGTFLCVLLLRLRRRYMERKRINAQKQAAYTPSEQQTPEAGFMSTA